MIPRQNVIACANPPRCPTKYDIVIGIIGKTQGVKIAASPNPKASTRKAASPSFPAAPPAAALVAAPGFASIYPDGIAAATACAAGSTFTVALIRRVLGGIQTVPLHVWYRGSKVIVSGPAAALFPIFTRAKNVCSPS